MSFLSHLALGLAESRRLPDSLVRRGVRRLLRQRLQQEEIAAASAKGSLAAFAAELRRGPIAEASAEANEQHYEVPAEFFQCVLGSHLKYSAGFWPPAVDSLDHAEEAMLELTCRRAGVEDGMSVLDLGCGWGSLALWIAGKYPNCRVQAVSNSRSQKTFIDRQAALRALDNLQVSTADMNDFSTSSRFDRILSVEMFEHMRNWPVLLERLAGWLEPDGKLFIHVFCHNRLAYLFQVDGDADWMARHFFTGGMMPAEKLLFEFQEDLEIEQHWGVDGRHYQRTAEAWLEHLDRNPAAIEQIFHRVYGPSQAARWRQRWRIFFIACAELFGYREGAEWRVAHYLLRRPEEETSARGPSRT